MPPSSCAILFADARIGPSRLGAVKLRRPSYSGLMCSLGSVKRMLHHMFMSSFGEGAYGNKGWHDSSSTVDFLPNSHMVVLERLRRLHQCVAAACVEG